MTTQRQDVTGTPRWQLAREIIAQLREMPAATAEAEIEVRLYNVLGFLFPNLKYPDLATQYQSGDGTIDVYCRNVVFETKRQGKKDDARVKPDGTIETPEEQATRYLDAFTTQGSLFDHVSIGWRSGITDGKEWSFYDYDRDAPDAEKLTPVTTMRLGTPADDEALLAYLYDFVDRTVRMAPPTNDALWVERLIQPFLELAAQYETSPEYGVKRGLWRGVLAGAFISPQNDAAAERDLFARHTMLVVIARSVAETLRPPELRTTDVAALRDKITSGFATWLLDAAGHDGVTVLDNIITEVNNYVWPAVNRDTLKDLYHTVIAREIRHDFGEYYTPDWLARAVCEEVMDEEWRRETIELAVGGQINGPAVLDPSCGSGTFLFHATQLLLDEARRHPELANSPQAQLEIVNDLVAGMDLHPVAVELAQTTKMLALSSTGYLPAHQDDFFNVHLGDSLQWEARRNEELFNQGNLINIPTDDPAKPLQLPRSLLLSEHFDSRLNQIFDYAERIEYPGIESDLAAVLGLPNAAEREAALSAYRRFREYIASGRNHVWRWYISNIVQPIRLAQQPVSRLVGNPPWVVYNAMTDERQDTFKEHAQDRNLWAGRHLATQNDLAGTFVATCVDYYLQTGGKFGFVLPYAALLARHWGPFRVGDWSLRQDAERGTHVDLSMDAWDFYGVSAPPFPQANSSVIFGTKVTANRQTPNLKPLAGIQKVSGEGVDTRMPWQDVRPLLQWNRRREWPTAPSRAYADAFRNGATLFPQSLVVFESPKSRARGVVYFRTNQAKGAWKGTERDGQIEERFVKPALFSRLLLPFGTNGNSQVIVPLSDDGTEVLREFPQGNDVQQFNLYWSSANADYMRIKSPKSPDSLANRIDLYNNFSAQLASVGNFKIVYNASGSNLTAAVIRNDVITSHNTYWIAREDAASSHYLAALFNAECLAEFFKEACRASDRDFMLLPVQNLPIAAYDVKNEHHVNLAAQSQLAHARVVNLVAERQAANRRITRNDVLRDTAMQPILASISESVRSILPDYCS